MKLMRILGAAVLAATFGVTAMPAKAAIALGDTLQIQYFYPDSSSVYQSNSTAFTGPGATLPIIYTGTAFFDVSQVLLTQNNTYTYFSASFSGIQISDLTNPNAFDGWTVLSSTA
jgi:hypothetical protein